MVRVPEPPAGTRKLSIGLVVSTGLLASLAAYFSLPGATRTTPRMSMTAPAATESSPARSTSPVHSIILTHNEPDLPPGPRRDAFVSHCTSCHSPRLVANQPPFPRAKWSEVVHKMVVAYGAPISAVQETEIVDYLMAYRGR
jgi:hypothetical protein